MSKPKDDKDRGVEELTIRIETQIVKSSNEFAEQYEVAFDSWVGINLSNAIIAMQITRRRAENKPPELEYEPQPDLIGDETPPAFIIPFGPIPALQRPHSLQDAAGNVDKRQYSDDDRPPTIELLPDSNPGGYWTHTVAPGETLSTIAGQYYNNPSQYLLIASANNIYSPYVIYVGQTLIVPKPELSNEQVNSISGGGECAAWRYYTVQPGDTLSAIAGQFYGVSSEYWRIANCNNILPPSYAIYVGDSLAIPARYV